MEVAEDMKPELLVESQPVRGLISRKCQWIDGSNLGLAGLFIEKTRFRLPTLFADSGGIGTGGINQASV